MARVPDLGEAQPGDDGTMDDVVEVSIDEFNLLNPNSVDFGRSGGCKKAEIFAHGYKTETKGPVVTQNGGADMDVVVNNDILTPDAHPQFFNAVDRTDRKEK